ncbi:MAG: aquaporin [Rhodoluna sp.]|jgi:glycerol uptake facilitator-like aquaporin
MKINNLLRKGIAEAMGVMIFVTSIMAANFNPTFKNVALAGTLTVMILLTATISGGHLNPAVSFFFFAKKSIDLSTLITYWIAQLAGGALGLYLGYALSGQSVSAVVGPTVSASGAFIGEVFATAVLILIIIRLATTKREAIIPFAVGLWVLVASTYTLTGAQANPAVTFALMLRDGFNQDYLMLVLAQFIGALLTLVYIIVLDSEKKKKVKK